MSGKIKFQFVNCAAGSNIQTMTVEEGTTLEQFLSSELSPDANPERMMARVNRRRAPMDYTLEDGDRVTVTPSDVTGA